MMFVLSFPRELDPFLSLTELQPVILDMEKYKVDKAGLARIIQLRRGIKTLEDDKVLKLMILW